MAVARILELFAQEFGGLLDVVAHVFLGDVQAGGHGGGIEAIDGVEGESVTPRFGQLTQDTVNVGVKLTPG